MGHTEYQGECQFNLLKDRKKKKKKKTGLTESLGLKQAHKERNLFLSIELFS